MKGMIMSNNHMLVHSILVEKSAIDKYTGQFLHESGCSSELHGTWGNLSNLLGVSNSKIKYILDSAKTCGINNFRQVDDMVLWYQVPKLDRGN